MWRWSSRRRAASALAWLLCALAAVAAAQDGWSLLRDDDGVRVFERDAPGRSLPELRGETAIDAPLAAVLAVVADVPGQTRWMHDCVESRVVKSESASTRLVYNRTGAPWPVSDRDVVLETVIDPVEPEKARVRFHSVASEAAPPLDGVVRMPRLVGEFALEALAPARTRVIYQLDIDPGGSLPTWLARSTARDLPFQTLRGLSREAAQRARDAVSSPP
jgi:hypothetical protein